MDTWENFLVDLLPDSAFREFLRRLVGYGYLAEPRDAGPVSAVFLGNGANGKTVLARALETALDVPVLDDGDTPEFAPRRFTVVVVNRLPRPFGPAVVLPFTEEFRPPGRDTRMLHRLREPEVQDAIRSWAYAGYLDFIRQGVEPARRDQAALVRESPYCERCCDTGRTGRWRCPDCNPGRLMVAWFRIRYGWLRRRTDAEPF